MKSCTCAVSTKGPNKARWMALENLKTTKKQAVMFRLLHLTDKNISHDDDDEMAYFTKVNKYRQTIKQFKCI